ncbi:hypothetical protein [Rhodococcus sp. 24CO]
MRRDARGKILDHPLQHPPLLRRLQVQMWKRRIGVETVSEASCSMCA